MLVQRARTRISLLCAGTLALALCALAYGQAVSPGSQATPPNSPEQILNHLDLVLGWARQWNSAEVYLIRPGDALYLENGRSLARQVVDLEFQSALAQAALIGNSSAKPTAPGAPSPGAASAQSILQVQQRIEQEMQTSQAQLKALNEKISTARTKDRPALISQRDTVQGQLQLAQALHENLDKLSSFMISSEMATQGGTALTRQIRARERANPTGSADQTAPKSKGKSTGAPASGPAIASSQNQGLIGQLGQMIHFVQGMRALKNLQDDTTQLQASTRQFRAPLLAAIRSTLKQGQIELSGTGQPTSPGGSVPANAAGTQPGPAGSTAPAAPATRTAAQTQQANSDLIAHFKQLSDATLPLSHELILIDQSQANLTQLRDSTTHDYISVLRALLLKVAVILIALALIWLFSELWRRATFRYIHDARRRRQFLTLRRVVTGFCMFVVIVLGFVSDFSSLATYAGLITAGVAVALQALILSVAAYFFLVGRYGVKVGDRVTVVYSGNNSVAGDVVEIGLVRFYMMELAGSGIDMQPTGRICVFPNSVLFQTNPLYKQLPGAEYAWREIGLPLSADSDSELAEKELLAAVNRLFATYRQTLEAQGSSIQATMGIVMKPPQPYTRRHFVPSGVEVMVRYPIPLRRAGELDDRMVVEVTELLRKNPSIKLAAGAAPEMRSPVKV